MAKDKILLGGMAFFGYHGNTEEEARLGQRFVVDLELYTDVTRAGSSDRIEDTVDYGKVYRLVQEVVEGSRYRLLEALATTVADRILEELLPEAVLVRIKKPSAPIPGHFDYMGVEILRQRVPSAQSGK